MKTFQRIIWATDPNEDKSFRHQSIEVLRDLSKKTKAKIEPVYVMNDGIVGLSVPKADFSMKMRDSSYRALNLLAKEDGSLNLTPSKVLVCSSSSASKTAATLDRYAQTKRADFILVNSHGRKGLKRAVLGSFAETLTLHSKTPILISGPKTKHIRNLDRILFPTDFSKESKKAFAKVQDLAKKLDAKITLFHVVLNPIEPILASGVGLLGGGFVTTEGYINHNYTKQKKQATQWITEAKQNGLMVDSAFDIEGTSVIESVLAYAKKKKLGLIAMASESSSVSAALLGSIGRGLAREAPCPVWFFRSKA